MEVETNQIDMDTLELSKENVQPRRQGRQAAVLAAALSSSADQETLRLQRKKQFEEELRSYAGEDPLDVWARYIAWLEEHFPSGGKKSHLYPVYEACVLKILNNKVTADKYRDDERFVRAVLNFVNFFDDPLSMLQEFNNRHVGRHCAFYYETWSRLLEELSYFKRADTVFRQGLVEHAEPRERLEAAHSAFQMRLARRVRDGVCVDAEPDEEGTRMAFGQLEAIGLKKTAPVDRSGAVAPRPLKAAVQKPQKTVSVLSTGAEHAPQRRVDSELLPHHERSKENVRVAGTWKEQKISLKMTVASTVSAEPTFLVHQDFAEPVAATPRAKAAPQFVGRPPLSAQKQEKKRNPFEQLDRAENSAECFMFPKDKMLIGDAEFSLEELRADKFWQKQRIQRVEEERVALQRRETQLQQWEQTLLQRGKMLDEQDQCILQVKEKHLDHRETQLLERERVLAKAEALLDQRQARIDMQLAASPRRTAADENTLTESFLPAAADVFKEEADSSLSSQKWNIFHENANVAKKPPRHSKVRPPLTLLRLAPGHVSEDEDESDLPDFGDMTFEPDVCSTKRFNLDAMRNMMRLHEDTIREELCAAETKNTRPVATSRGQSSSSSNGTGRGPAQVNQCANQRPAGLSSFNELHPCFPDESSIVFQPDALGDHSGQSQRQRNDSSISNSSHPHERFVSRRQRRDTQCNED